MTMNLLLRRKLVDNLSQGIERRLNAVNYWCLRGELDSADDIDHERFYFGGEVELRFEGLSSLYVTWDESAGWSSTFSIQVSERHIFDQGTLQSLEASCSPMWREVVGKKLNSAEVRGWNDSPYMIVLNFTSNAAIIGVGSGANFGDGDDVLVRRAEGNDDLRRAKVLWSSYSAHVSKIRPDK